MFSDEQKTPATYLEHHKQPVCNLYLNPQNGTEVCVSLTKIYIIVADVDCFSTYRAIYYC